MMSENMGYPDYIQDDKLLDNEYKDVSIYTGITVKQMYVFSITA